MLTVAGDAHRRVTEADRALRTALVVSDRAEAKRRTEMALSDLGVALLSIEALQIHLERLPVGHIDQDKTPLHGVERKS